MNLQELAAIVREQKEELAATQARADLIDREYLDRWREWMSTDLVKVVTGIRRCGKSVLATQLLRGAEFAYLDLDDERLAGLTSETLNQVVEAFEQVYPGRRAIFLDEVQNIEGWELFVNRLRRAGYNQVLTGSNSHLLSKELGTRLTGRYIPIELFPFSFREYLELRGVAVDVAEGPTTHPKAALVARLEEYLEQGGFPEMLRDPSKMRPYLQNLYSTLLAKDVIARNPIRYVRRLREVANYLLSSFAQEVSFTKIKNQFSFRSVHTAKNYVGYLQEAYLILLVERYDPKPKEVIRAARKVYGLDTGLVNSVAFRAHEQRGRLLENLVAVELFRRRALKPLSEIYYWKDLQQREVDFLIKEGTRVRELIQVSFVSDGRELRRGEIEALVRAGRSLGVRELKLLTWDYQETLRVDGLVIEAVPVWRWLLSPSVPASAS